MNSNETPLWSNQQNVGDSSLDTRIDDFANFLNFGVDFGGDAAFHSLMEDQSHNQSHHDPNVMDTSGCSNMPSMVTRNSMNDHHHHHHHNHPQLSSGDIINLHLQSIQQQQQQLAIQEAQLRRGSLRQNLINNSIIPPTPTSMDLQGEDCAPQMFGHRTFLSKEDQVRIQRQRYHLPSGAYEAQMVFTPLVSPAVTPLVTPVETSFGHLPDFSMPGAYFSPLTSPALEAQRHVASFMQYGPFLGSKDTSPIEFTESPVIKAKISQITGRRKSAASGRNPSRIGKSPGMGPQRKKGPIPLTPITTKDSSSNTTSQQPSTPTRQSFNNNNVTEHIVIPSGRESSTESISPEPMIPESVMAPPPPRSSSNQSRPSPNRSVPPLPISPSIVPQSPATDTASAVPSSASSSSSSSSCVKPATPASLMKLAKSSIPADAMNPSPLAVLDNDSAVGNFNYNDSSSPEAVADEDDQSTPIINPRTNKAQTNTRNNTTLLKLSNNSRQQSPKTPNLAPTPSQNGIRTVPNSASSTPTIVPANSKQSNASGSKPVPKSSSNTRKRPSISQSPALIPKISPNIKPLLPTTMQSFETSASILLASKSNYQNIVEGTSSSLGLQYPEHLSTNLTSKRTSHKIAEQGRRDRINNALQEIAGLLPPPDTPGLKAANAKDDKDDEEGSGGGKEGGSSKEGSNRGNQATQTSKAVTVERAIEYIKQLKRELEEAQGELDATRSRLRSYEEMDKRVHLEISEEVEGSDESERQQEVQMEIDSGFVDGDRPREEKRRNISVASGGVKVGGNSSRGSSSWGGGSRPGSSGSVSSSNRGSMCGSPNEKSSEAIMIE